MTGRQPAELRPVKGDMSHLVLSGPLRRRRVQRDQPLPAARPLDLQPQAPPRWSAG